QRVVHVEPREVRHAHVEHQAGRLAPVAPGERLDGLQRVAPGAHLEAGAAQPEAGRLAELGVVVEDVDRPIHFSPSSDEYIGRSPKATQGPFVALGCGPAWERPGARPAEEWLTLHTS